MYTFNTKNLGITHSQLCRFNTFNSLISTSHQGWFKNEYVTVKGRTLPESFLTMFIDVGNIQAMNTEIPQPKKIK